MEPINSVEEFEEWFNSQSEQFQLEIATVVNDYIWGKLFATALELEEK
jgi:hypothetical protein